MCKSKKSLVIGCAAVLAVWNLPLSLTAQNSNEFYELDEAVLQLVSIIELPANASGPLSNMKVTTGSFVSRDQVLATVMHEEADVNLAEAMIELEIAQRQVESNLDIKFALKSKQVALADYRRAQDSNRGYAGVVSDREMDRLRLMVEKSDAEIEKIRFEKSILAKQVELKKTAVRRRRIELERHQIRAAVDAQVVEIYKQENEWVNVSDPVMKLIQLDRLKVEVFVPAAIANPDLVQVSAVFVPATPTNSDVKVTGNIVFVSPIIDPLNKQVKLTIEFENIDLTLRPGMKGKVILLSPPGNEESKKVKPEGQIGHSEPATRIRGR